MLFKSSRWKATKVCLFGIPFFFAVGSILAPTQSLAATSEIDQRLSVSNLQFTDHDWFFYLSAGTGRASYDDEINGAVDRAKAIGLESPQTGFFDLPGVYYQLRPGFAVGAILTMSFEHFSKNWRNAESFAVQSYSPSVSAFYFFNGRMGEGWFTRADLGATRIYQREVQSTGPNQYVERLSNRDGVLGQLAFGYGWEASHFARVLIHANAFASTAGPNAMNGLTLNIGFLL